VPYHGQPVVAEVRVFPADEWPGRRLGEWRAELLGVLARDAEQRSISGIVPVKTGLAAPTLRSVPFSMLRQFAPRFIDALMAQVKQTDKGLLSVGLGSNLWESLGAIALHKAGMRRQSETPAPASRGPRAWSDRRYAQIAAAYVAQIEAGHRQVYPAIARRFRLTPEQVRDAIHTARHKRGLLSRTTKQGRPGGQLTPKAVALLAPITGQRRKGR
jgi:hypothetical protein